MIDKLLGRFGGRPTSLFYRLLIEKTFDFGGRVEQGTDYRSKASTKLDTAILDEERKCFSKVVSLIRRLLSLFSIIVLTGTLNACSETDIDESIVRIIVTSKTGSGFVVASGGYVATNHHVIDTGGRKRGQIIVFREGKEVKPYEGHLIWSSPELDLALLRVPELNAPPLSINDATLEKEDLVRAVGFPGASNVVDQHGDAYMISTRTVGEVSRTFEADWLDLGRQIRVVQHTAAINRGSSGGPLINACDEVVGVNTLMAAAQLENLGQRGMQIDVKHSTFFASHARELAAILRVRNISADIRSEPCGTDVVSATVVTVVTVTSVLSVITLITWFLLSPRFAGLGPDWLRPRLITNLGSVLTGTKPHLISTRWLLEGQLPDGQGHITLSLEESHIGKAGSIILGRDPAICDLVISHPTVSSRGHARFYSKGNDLMIADLRSTNGTFVDGVKLGGPGSPEAIKLRHGMQVMVGAVRLFVSKTG